MELRHALTDKPGRTIAAWGFLTMFCGLGGLLLLVIVGLVSGDPEGVWDGSLPGVAFGLIFVGIIPIFVLCVMEIIGELLGGKSPER